MALAELKYFSHALGKMHAAVVLVPETGPGDPEVLFLLHGLSDDHTAWTRKSRLERWAEGRNVLIVMPDGGRSFYVDAAEGDAYGTAIGRELPDLIARTFRTAPGRASIAGLSMGGYGAFRIALADPARWSRAHSFSGALDFGHGEWRMEQPEFVRILGDRPEDRDADLLTLASRRPDVALTFDCGTEDFLIEHNRAYRDALIERSVPHEYREFPGAHDWSYWDDHVVDILDRWFPSAPK